MDPTLPISTHKESKVSVTTINWLRAAVLGADDGIVSVAALVVGIAGASDSKSFILTAGISGLVAGALSMAAGEYVSVSTERDTESALVDKEKWELINQPAQELEELTVLYEKKGLSRETAALVAKELTVKDPFKAHADAELHIDPDNMTNPLAAATASAVSFSLGAIIPLIAIIMSPVHIRIPITFISVVVALAATGAFSAYAGGANKSRATIRVVIGGTLAMIITYGIGKLFGSAGI